MPIFSRARKTSGLEDTGVGVQKSERTARSRAASFDLPVSTHTLNPRRWSGKQSEASRDRSDSGSSSVNGGHSAYRQLNFERGSHSKPPTTGPSRDRSSSLFARSKEKLFRRSSNASKPTTLEAPLGQPSSTPVPLFDGTEGRLNSPAAIDESELELVRLRDDAARSIGMTPPPPSLEDIPMKSTRILGRENSSGTRHTIFPPPRTDLVSPHSTISFRADQTIRPLPPFPCTRGALRSHVQLHSPVHLYRSSTRLSTIFSKLASRSWKSRHLVLSAYTAESNLSPGHRIRTDTLHVFKGTFPDDEETDRLYLTVFSAVTPAGPDIPEACNRRNVIHVSGFANGAVLEDNVVTSGQEVSWLFQVPDEESMRVWALKLEREVLDQRNAINTVARNFPERRVSAPVRINSVRQSKLLVHRRPVGDITPEERPGSPPGLPQNVTAHREFTFGKIAHGATFQSTSAAGESTSDHSQSLSHAPPRRSLQAAFPLPSQSLPEGNKPYSHARVMSLDGTSSYARSAVARFLSGLPDSDGPTVQRPSSRSGSPAPPNSLPAPPRSPRPPRGATSSTSPTKRHFSHLTTLVSSHLDMDTDTGDEADGYLASAPRAMSPPLDYLSMNGTLRREMDVAGHDHVMSRLSSLFGTGPEDEAAHIFGDESGQTSRTRTSSASSRDPRLDRSNSRRTRGREGLPPMPPPPRSRLPDAPGSSPSSREKTASPGNGTTLARPRMPSIRPSTTFGGGDQVTPPPSIKASGVTPSSHSMRSQLSDGTTRTHATNYEAAAQDGRSSRNGSISAAVAAGATSEQYPGSWAVSSGFAHPYATPSRSSHSHSSETSNPPSQRTSHEDSAPAASERKGQRSSMLPPPRPAPTGGLPPTPADQRAPKQRHGSSGSTQYVSYVDANDPGVERSRPPVSVPSSYRDRPRRSSALPSAYRGTSSSSSSPPAAPMQDPFVVTSGRVSDASTDSLNGMLKYTRPSSPLFVLGGTPVRRTSSSRKPAQNSDSRDSPYNSFLNIDTPGSNYASLPPTVLPLPLPPESLPPHIVRPLPPIAPRYF